MNTEYPQLLSYIQVVHVDRNNKKVREGNQWEFQNLLASYGKTKDAYVVIIGTAIQHCVLEL